MCVNVQELYVHGFVLMESETSGADCEGKEAK